MQLTFTGNNGESALLAMTPELLLNWLAIIQHSYRKATWPTADWPPWFTGANITRQGQQQWYHVPNPANA
jgi:hypothetical protein